MAFGTPRHRGPCRRPRALKRLTLKQLGEIEITSVSKTPEAVWNTPAAIFVVTNEDIARSGATSIPDALRLVPGVEVARIDTSSNWVVGIRGFGDQFSKSVLVLIDGRSAYTPLWAGVHWPIQDTLLEDVDRIEVIRGPGGTIWGANAQNGVINIITKSARVTHGVYASGLIGNVDEAIGGIRVGGGRGNWDYRVYAKGSKRAPQDHQDGREFDTWGMGQVGARLDWHRRDDEVTVSGDAYVAQLGESVRVYTFRPPSAALVDDPVDVHGFNVLAAWRRSHSNGASWRVQAYVDSTYRLGTDFGERRTTVDIDAIQQQAPWRAHSLSWGLGARTSPSRIIQTYAFSDFEPAAHTLNWFSAFVQDAVTVRPRRLTVTAGAKLEHNTYSGLDLQPSLRALWTPSERHSVWAGASRASPHPIARGRGHQRQHPRACRSAALRRDSRKPGPGARGSRRVGGRLPAAGHTGAVRRRQRRSRITTTNSSISVRRRHGAQSRKACRIPRSTSPGSTATRAPRRDSNWRPVGSRLSGCGCGGPIPICVST